MKKNEKLIIPAIKGLEMVLSRKDGIFVPMLGCQLCGNVVVLDGNAMVFYNEKEGIMAHKSCMFDVKNNNIIWLCKDRYYGDQ